MRHGQSEYPIQLIYWDCELQLKNMKFQFEAIVGDRYESIDYLDDDEIYNCLMNMQKQDILNVKTENDYWEDIPEELFELFKNNIKYKKYEYAIANGRLLFSMEISLEKKSELEPEPEPEPEPES
tara:strand:- start:77 stop:451 length:375 start_codon:yes stop_codon:yes gene_type:complete